MRRRVQLFRHQFATGLFDQRPVSAESVPDQIPPNQEFWGCGQERNLAATPDLCLPDRCSIVLSAYVSPPLADPASTRFPRTCPGVMLEKPAVRDGACAFEDRLLREIILFLCT